MANNDEPEVEVDYRDVIVGSGDETDDVHETDSADESDSVDQADEVNALLRGERIVRTETTHYIRIADDAHAPPSHASPRPPRRKRRSAPARRPDAADGDLGLTPGLLAFAVLSVATLLGLGWYVGTRAAAEPSNVNTFDATAFNRLVDAFDRDAPGDLTSVESTALGWSTIGAPFAINDGLATIGNSDESDVGIALLASGWSNATIGATVGNAPAGTGLVFRYVDVFNYWSLTSAPEFGTWNLNLVVAGEPERTEPIGLVATDPGTQLSVLLDGPRIAIFVNGIPALSATDPTFELATAAGLLAPTASGGSFDDFTITEQPTIESSIADDPSNEAEETEAADG